TPESSSPVSGTRSGGRPEPPPTPAVASRVPRYLNDSSQRCDLRLGLAELQVHLPGRLQGTRCLEKPSCRPGQVQRLVRRRRPLQFQKPFLEKGQQLLKVRSVFHRRVELRLLQTPMPKWKPAPLKSLPKLIHEICITAAVIKDHTIDPCAGQRKPFWVAIPGPPSPQQIPPPFTSILPL